jgi:hypothetical protein
VADKRNAYTILVGKSLGKPPPRKIWEYDNDMDLTHINSGEWILLKLLCSASTMLVSYINSYEGKDELFEINN